MRKCGKGRKQTHDVGQRKALKNWDAKLAATRRRKARKRAHRVSTSTSTGFIRGIPHRST